ncbi:MFS transporter [Pseudanabaena sp. FACHB-2040]|uniref:MFS transporter n=1 Tax=Pseudanabaena sp. FACHB-2040 TaxID=2692859 RepID=UPI00168574C9|nr:MFS transporter [Pseudanabaena sp. FACHB-2040]MBD2256466.1 MFS transporter [Pseudanabaena sp. FACHB-2040]
MAQDFPQPPTSPSPAPGKLSFRAKLAFGAGDMGAGMTSNLIAFSFLIFLTSAAGLDPLIAGTVLLIGKVWDAVNDPMVGYLSDRIHTRWGRRYPWMFLGALPFGLTFFLMWLVPDLGQTGKFWYYVLTSVLFQVFFTVVNLPYTTLTAELSQDYDERTELTAFRLASSLVGAIGALALGLVVTQFIAVEQQQYLALGGLCAVLSVLPIFWCIFGTYPFAKRQLQANPVLIEDPSTRIPFLAQLKIVFSNRAFLVIVGIYMFSWLALQATASIIPFYVTFWMGIDSYFLPALLVQGTAIPMMFVVNLISKRVGKQGAFYIGIGSWLIVQMGLFFLQPGQTAALYLLCMAASFGVATAYVVPWAMLPDVIELDELQTGQRREGIFYAFMTLLQKFGLALGLFLVGAALEGSGFVSEAVQQPDSALTAIRLFMGPLPMLMLIASMIIIRFYPITRHVHEEMLLKLAERRKQSAQ